MNQRTTHRRLRQHDTPARAFTLVELLVVVAVIGILIGVLLPALAGARAAALDTVSRTNVRSICQAFFSYSFTYEGQYPANTVGGPGSQPTSWFDGDVIGEFLIETYKGGEDFGDDIPDTVGGSVYVSPSHPDGGRSYTMNYWASSNVMSTSRGEPFNANNVRQTSQTLLIGDAWGQFAASDGEGGTLYVTSSTMGANGQPGERFGGGDGLIDFPGDALPRRGNAGAPEFGGKTPTSYLPYYRHPRRTKDTTGITGAATIGFADGHVNTQKAESLFDPGTGVSSLEVLWSRKDFELASQNSTPTP